MAATWNTLESGIPNLMTMYITWHIELRTSQRKRRVLSCLFDPISTQAHLVLQKKNFSQRYFIRCCTVICYLATVAE